MDQVNHNSFERKFHTLENRNNRKYRQNDLMHSISFDETKMKNGNAQNGISGVLMRPLDLDSQPVRPNGVNHGHNLQNNITSHAQIAALSSPSVLTADKHGPQRTLAVEARNVIKYYGPRSNRVHVLKGLNLSVPHGAM